MGKVREAGETGRRGGMLLLDKIIKNVIEIK